MTQTTDQTDQPTAPAWFDDPSSCPDWCVGQHRQALDEGNTVQYAARHMSVDRMGLLTEIRWHEQVWRPMAGSWDVWMERMPSDVDRGVGGMDLIQLHARGADDWPSENVTLQLTAGEARQLAAQLVAFADKAAR